MKKYTKKEILIQMTIKDNTKLRQLIIDNPTLPLLILCGEECWSGEYGYETQISSSASIQELTIYNDYWLDRDDFKDNLTDDLSNEEAYGLLSNDEFDKMVDDIVADTEFVKAITIYVG